MKKIPFRVPGPEPTLKLLDFTRGQVGSVIIGSARFEAGQRLPAEGFSQHSGDEVSYIISGQLSGESGGVPFSIAGGDLTIIPADELHWAVAGDEPVELIYVMIEKPATGS
jgi:quercetin dioxygenase-like cupin family protein